MIYDGQRKRGPAGLCEALGFVPHLLYVHSKTFLLTSSTQHVEGCPGERSQGSGLNRIRQGKIRTDPRNENGLSLSFLLSPPQDDIFLLAETIQYLVEAIT